MIKNCVILFGMFILFSSCSPKLNGKYKFSDFQFLHNTIDFSGDDFYYRSTSDQSSSEGYGKYLISNDTLILNFKDTTRYIPKENVVFTPTSNSYSIYFTNINKKAYKLEYVITNDAGHWVKHTHKSIKPNETVQILEHLKSADKGLTLNCTISNGKQVSYQLEEEGEYNIKYEFTPGPSALISGQVFRLPIVEISSDSFILKEYGTKSIYKRVLD